MAQGVSHRCRLRCGTAAAPVRRCGIARRFQGGGPRRGAPLGGLPAGGARAGTQRSRAQGPRRALLRRCVGVWGWVGVGVGVGWVGGWVCVCGGGGGRRRRQASCAAVAAAAAALSLAHLPAVPPRAILKAHTLCLGLLPAAAVTSDQRSPSDSMLLGRDLSSAVHPAAFLAMAGHPADGGTPPWGVQAALAAGTNGPAAPAHPEPANGPAGRPGELSKHESTAGT